MFGKRWIVVNLVYFDDSTNGPLTIVGALIIPHHSFSRVELLTEIVAKILPGELGGLKGLENIEEFHAEELFQGTKAFQGIPQEQRYAAIRTLLGTIPRNLLTFIYSAVRVNVLTWIRFGGTSACSSAVTPCMSAYVFPVPGPARTRTGA